MSDYTKTTNFGVKDGLSTGDSNKLVKGSDFDTEFDAIALAVATKADSASPTFTTPALGTPSSGTLTNCTGLPAAGLSDVTSTAAELNVLDGITATVTELNYTDGVTSAIQTQLDALGSGDVSKVGTPVNDQVGVWTGDGTIEGSAMLTFGIDGSSYQWLDTGNDTTVAGIKLNTTIFAYEASGVITVQNVTGLDATTSATIATSLESSQRHKGTTTRNSSTVMQLATAMFTDDDDEYILRFRHLIPATDNADLYLLTSINTGSSYDTGATDYRQSGADATEITICTGVGSAANEDGVSGEIHLVRPKDASDHNHIYGHGMYIDTSGNPQRWEIAATRKSTTAVDGLRLTFSTGDIDNTSCNMSLYAVRTDT